MVTDRTFRIAYRPSNITQFQNENGVWQDRWTVPDSLMESVNCNKALRLGFGGFTVSEKQFGFSLKNPAKDLFWLSTINRNL